MVVIGKQICKVDISWMYIVNTVGLKSFYIKGGDGCVATFMGLRKKLYCLINESSYSKAKQVVRSLQCGINRKLYNINISEADLW